MLFKTSISLAVLIICNVANANFSCRMTEHFGNPALANNAKFWEDVGEVSANGGGDRELANLLKKYGVDERQDSMIVATERRRTPPPPTAPAYQLARKATKELETLRPSLRVKANDFLELARQGRSTFYKGLRNNQERWRLHHLEGGREQSANLDNGYRAIFRERDDGVIEVLRFSKTASHSSGNSRF